MIIDHFMFFNEKELLELRVNMLKDCVDKFIISESSRTHSGKPKEFICKKLIKELGLPEDKIEVIEVDIPPEEELTPNSYDLHHAAEAHSSHAVLTWTRERLQRDALYGKVDVYPDDTVFILSDLDEIINPEAINFVAGYCRNENCVIKLPLVLLEGEANKRLYHEDGTPVPWEKSLLMCTKYHMMNSTFTEIRGELTFRAGWMMQSGEKIQDMGWHFTWMGGTIRNKIKASSYLHHANMDVLNNISSQTCADIGASTTGYICKAYPLKNLPKKIFDLPRVFEFLLPYHVLEETKLIFK